MQTNITPHASLPNGFQGEYSQVTLYWHVSFTGYSKCEARNTVVKTERYAQFHNAVKIELQLRGKRKWHFQRQTSNPSVVILAGWGHPDLPPAFDSGGRARHYSFDQGWSMEFDAFLKSYLKSSNATVLLDLRNHDSEEQKFVNASAPAPTFLSSENRSTATDYRRKIPPVNENMADFFEGSPTEVVLTRY